jgi:hypothetical protein
VTFHTRLDKEGLAFPCACGVLFKLFSFAKLLWSHLTSPILNILIKRMKMKGIQLCYFLGQYLIYFTIILHKVNGLEIWWWLAVSLGRLVLVSITCPFALLSVSHNLGTWIRKVLANRLNRGYNLRYWIYVTCTCWPLSAIG